MLYYIRIKKKMEQKKKEKKLILDLVASVLFASPFDGDFENIDVKYIVIKLKEQKLENIAYYALLNLNISNELSSILEKMYLNRLQITLNQEREYQNIIQVFENNKIDYVPLKGMNVKKYYPHEDMRLMGDIDILIHKEKRLYVRKTLIKNDYNFDKSSASCGHHEIYNKNRYGHFEIHYNLFDDGTQKDDYFDKNVWLETNNHEMSKEFEVAFLLSHYYKHFYHGGASFKSMLDIALILNKYEIDSAKLKDVLDKTDYYVFYCNVVDIINYCFKTKIKNYESLLNESEIEEIVDYIFACGDFGFGEENDYERNAIMNQLGSKKVTFFSKLGYIIKRVCIPYRVFKNINKIIKYVPILLPFGWIVRFFKYLFRHNHQEIKHRLDSIGNVSEKDIEGNKTINKFLNIRKKEER